MRIRKPKHKVVARRNDLPKGEEPCPKHPQQIKGVCVVCDWKSWYKSVPADKAVQFTKRVESMQKLWVPGHILGDNLSMWINYGVHKGKLITDPGSGIGPFGYDVEIYDIGLPDDFGIVDPNYRGTINRGHLGYNKFHEWLDKGGEKVLIKNRKAKWSGPAYPARTRATFEHMAIAKKLVKVLNGDLPKESIMAKTAEPPKKKLHLRNRPQDVTPQLSLDLQPRKRLKLKNKKLNGHAPAPKKLRFKKSRIPQLKVKEKGNAKHERV